MQLQDVEDEAVPVSFRQDGASVFLRTSLRVGPAGGDHEALSKVLATVPNADHLLPSKVNSNSLAAWVREHLDPNVKLPLVERLLSPDPKPLPRELLPVLGLTEVREVVVNSAGNDYQEA